MYPGCSQQQVHPDGIADIPLENALALLRINKQSAREMLGRSLPVPDQTLAHHQKVLFQCAQAAKDKQRRVIDNSVFLLFS